MADRSHGQHHVTPTGMVLHEPTFPNIAGSPSDRTDEMTSTRAESNLATPVGPSGQAGATEPSQSSYFPPTQPKEDTSESARPMQQRWATERPKPSVRHSLFGKAQHARREKRPAPVNRGTTVTFDPYSSESNSDSDDSDDEKPFPQKSLTHTDSLAKQETRTRRSSNTPFSRLKITNEHFHTKGKVSKADGRLKLSILEKDLDSGYVAKALGAVLKKHSNDGEKSVESYDARGIHSGKIAPEDDDMENDLSRRVKLNIVIIIIGSRGDVQPFIRIAKILQDDYGHRVRLATHPAFKDFVEKDSGLEFFSVGGNPAELMAFMVKNPGLIPNIDTIKGGEIGRRRAQMYEMFQGMWRACINATDDETDVRNVKMSELSNLSNSSKLANSSQWVTRTPS